MSRAPGLHQCAMFVPRIAGALDYVPARRVRGHRHVRDERLILASVVRKHPHYHLQGEDKSCQSVAGGRLAFGEVQNVFWAKRYTP